MPNRTWQLEDQLHSRADSSIQASNLSRTVEWVATSNCQWSFEIIAVQVNVVTQKNTKRSVWHCRKLRRWSLLKQSSLQLPRCTTIPNTWQSSTHTAHTTSGASVSSSWLVDELWRRKLVTLIDWLIDWSIDHWSSALCVPSVSLYSAQVVQWLSRLRSSRNW